MNDGIKLTALLPGVFGLIRGRREAFVLLTLLGATISLLLGLPFSEEARALQEAINGKDQEAMMAALSALYPDILPLLLLKAAAVILVPLFWIRYVRLGDGPALAQGLGAALWRTLGLTIGLVLIALGLFLVVLLVIAVLSLLPLSPAAQTVAIFAVIFAVLLPLQLSYGMALLTTAIGGKCSAPDGAAQLRGAWLNLILFLVFLTIAAILLTALITAPFGGMGANQSLPVKFLLESVNQASWLLFINALLYFRQQRETGANSPRHD